jgi:hypothetical protein
MRKSLLILFACAIVLAPGVSRAQTDDEFEKCDRDARVICHGVTVGEGRIMRCLTAERTKLSPDCRKVVDKYAR